MRESETKEETQAREEKEEKKWFQIQSERERKYLEKLLEKDPSPTQRHLKAQYQNEMKHALGIKDTEIAESMSK